MELNSVDTEKEKRNYFEWLPQEIILKIFSHLDIQSLFKASMTCTSWNRKIRNNDFLWKPHCLALRAVCAREIEDNLARGYSWRDTLLKNYRMSQVKRDWLSGRYSNVSSPDSLLQEDSMCPMDAESWGEILEAELKDQIKNVSHNCESLKLK